MGGGWGCGSVEDRVLLIEGIVVVEVYILKCRGWRVWSTESVGFGVGRGRLRLDCGGICIFYRGLGVFITRVVESF